MCNCEKLLSTFSQAENLAESGSAGEAYRLYSQFIDRSLKCIPDTTDDEQKTQLVEKLSLAYNNRGFIRYNRVDFDKAVDDYTEALKLNNRLYLSFYNRGLIHYRLGRYDKAIDDMTRALTIQPDFTPAQSCLSQATVDKQNKGLKS